MAPKFKGKQTRGNRLMGTFFDGEQWVTNGYWAAKADLVEGLTAEQITAFAVGNGWRQTDKELIIEKGVEMDVVLKTDGLDLIECEISPLSIGDKKYRHGFTIDNDNMLQTYPWDCLTPLEEFQIKSVRGKNVGLWAYCQEKIVARAMPSRLNLSGPPQEMEGAIAKFKGTTFPAKWKE